MALWVSEVKRPVTAPASVRKSKRTVMVAPCRSITPSQLPSGLLIDCPLASMAERSATIVKINEAGQDKATRSIQCHIRVDHTLRRHFFFEPGMLAESTRSTGVTRKNFRHTEIEDYPVLRHYQVR